MNLHSIVAYWLRKARTLRAIRGKDHSRQLQCFFGNRAATWSAHLAAEEPGFDLASLSDEYLETRTECTYAFDYPVMFWLRNAFEAGARSIFDIGGSVVAVA